jgi:hypothetical protein
MLGAPIHVSSQVWDSHSFGVGRRTTDKRGAGSTSVCLTAVGANALTRDCQIRAAGTGSRFLASSCLKGGILREDTAALSCVTVWQEEQQRTTTSTWAASSKVMTVRPRLSRDSAPHARQGCIEASGPSLATRTDTEWQASEARCGSNGSVSQKPAEVSSRRSAGSQKGDLPTPTDPGQGA